MTKEFDYSPIDKILENHEKTAVIAILQDIQEIYHYLPKEIFPYLAKKLGTGEARIYSVATFYENFSLEPKGKYVIIGLPNWKGVVLYGKGIAGSHSGK